MRQDGVGCSGQQRAVRASGGKWNWGGGEGGFRVWMWKESLSACVPKVGQERPVFTRRINTGLGEPQSWSGRWGEVTPQTLTPLPHKFSLETGPHTQTRAFRKQLLWRRWHFPFLRVRGSETWLPAPVQLPVAR